MLDFPHLANTQNGAETSTFYALGANDWQTWMRPRGKSHANVIVLGGGGGGGNGFGAAAATARGGGGGGGSTTICRLMCVPLDLLPETLFINVGLGGNAGLVGSNTTVSLRPDILFQNRVVAATGGSPGGTGTAAAVGAAGAAATATGASGISNLGVFLCSAGVAGGAGGAIAGGIGVASSFSATANLPFLTGGAGGGGTTSADFAGGAITGGNWFPSLPGGTAGISRGSDGIYMPRPFASCGGSGGAGINAGIGGNGGDGAIGCGGGGGGAGTTAGVGGKGGGGLVIITCW